MVGAAEQARSLSFLKESSCEGGAGACAGALARDNKPANVAILKRFVRLNDEDLVAKSYDYHKRAETPDGKSALPGGRVIKASLQAGKRG